MGSYWKLILLVFMMVVLVSMGAKDDDKPEVAVEGGDKPKDADEDDDDTLSEAELKKKNVRLHPHVVKSVLSYSCVTPYISCNNILGSETCHFK